MSSATTSENFWSGSPDQCEQLGLLLAGQAVQLSMQMYGCRVVRKHSSTSIPSVMALVSRVRGSPVASLYTTLMATTSSRSASRLCRVSREQTQDAEFCRCSYPVHYRHLQGPCEGAPPTLTAAAWCSASSSTVPTSKSKSFWRNSANAARTLYRIATATT